MSTNFFKMSLIAILVSGCASLHHVQLSSVDNTKGDDEVAVPFDIKVSEIGVNTEEAGRIANNDIGAIIAMFQMGSRTGNPVYTEKYADKVVYEIYQKCPSGKIVNLMSIREARKYPVISGEIVKITGECVNKKVKGI